MYEGEEGGGRDGGRVHPIIDCTRMLGPKGVRNSQARVI